MQALHTPGNGCCWKAAGVLPLDPTKDWLSATFPTTHSHPSLPLMWNAWLPPCCSKSQHLLIGIGAETRINNWINRRVSLISVTWNGLYGLIFGWSCVEQGVGLLDPYRSLPTWDSLWFHDIKSSKAKHAHMLYRAMSRVLLYTCPSISPTELSFWGFQVKTKEKKSKAGNDFFFS